MIVVTTDAVYTDLSSTFAVDLYKEWTDLLVQQFEISDDKSSASDVVNFPKVKSGPATFIGQTNEKAHSFHSIPYAEPPTGNLRFKPPVKKVWEKNEIFNASEPNFIQCYQLRTPKGHYSEDCLVVNVHVPRSINADQLESGNFKEKLPVMVFIHGGAYFVGSSTGRTYDGRFLCSATNTVVVTMNYRLASFGFLYYVNDDVSYTGNQAIKDQQLALKWVHENIGNFGGDKSQVTLLGESAGSQSVMFHMVSPVSEPYFNRAIMQSNPAVYKYLNPGEAQTRGENFIGTLNCSAYENTTDCLKNVSPIELIRKTSEFSIELAKRGYVLEALETFRPTIDQAEFTKNPLMLFREGNWQTYKELIIGSNVDEFVLLTERVLRKGVDFELFKRLNKLLVGARIEPYMTLEYSKLVPANAGDDFNYIHVVSREVRDLYFTCSTRALARFAASTTDVGSYLYVYEHNACPNVTSQNRFCAHTCHGCEIPFEFGTLEFAGRREDESDALIITMFGEYWKNFAYFGAPHAESFTKWPVYYKSVNNPSHDWANLRIISPQSRLDYQFNEDFCDFWDATGIYNG